MFGKTKRDMKAQSAMEYLMTYGWAILIIAVVLAALFELGVFNGSNLGPQACIAQAGFVCRNPIYTANGIGITFGQTTGRDYYGDWVFVAAHAEALNQNGIPINFTCTATGCANAVSVGVLVPGQIVGVDFNASKFAYGQIPANAPIGTPFAGYVWLGYCFSPCSAPTAYSKMATITAKEAGTSSTAFGGYFGGGSGGVTTTTTSIATTSTLYQVEFSVSPADTGTTTPTNTVQEAPGNSITITATPDSGYIFTGWSSSTGNMVIANQSAESTTANIDGSGTLTAGFAIPYVQISLSTSGTTPSPFQQMLSIRGYSAFTYNGVTYNGINQQWSNVEFTSGGPCISQSCSGVTPLEAWCESGCSGSSTAIVWVKLPSGFSGSTIIYMNFMPNDVMSASGPTGEAPQLSSPYGQYDNGANVFEQYGGKSWSGFTLLGPYGGASTWTTANGYLQQTSTAPTDGGASTPVAYIGSTQYANNGYYIIESSFSYGSQSNARVGIVADLTTGPNYPTGYRFIGENGYNGNGWISFLNDYVAWVVDGGYAASIDTVYTEQVTNAGGTWSASLFPGSTISASQLTSLSATSYVTPNYYGATSGYIGISATNNNQAANPLNVYWFRLRAYPPNGVMPSATFGAVQ